MTPGQPNDRPAPAGAATVPPEGGTMPARGVYVVEEFPRMPWRRRLRVIALALATAGVVMGSVLAPPGASKTKRLPPPDAARCTPGQDTGCVGGTATVIVAPAPSPGPAAEPAPSPATTPGPATRASAPGLAAPAATPAVAPVPATNAASPAR